MEPLICALLKLSSKLCRDCQLELIEGAGHLPFEETPDEFNRLVLDFVDQQ